MEKKFREFYLKSDILLLKGAFEKFISVSFNEFGINPLYCVSLLGLTWQNRKKHTGKNLQTPQDNKMILLLEKTNGGFISSVMGGKDVKSKKRNINAITLYG